MTLDAAGIQAIAAVGALMLAMITLIGGWTYWLVRDAERNLRREMNLHQEEMNLRLEQMRKRRHASARICAATTGKSSPCWKAIPMTPTAMRCFAGCRTPPIADYS